MDRAVIASRLSRQVRNSFILACGDVVVLALALLAGRYLVYVLADAPLSPRYTLLMLPVWCLGAMAVGLLPAWGLGVIEELRRLEILLLALFAAGGVAVLFGREMFYPSPLAYTSAWFCSAVGIPLVRSSVKGWLHRRGSWGCPVVIYGAPRTVERVAQNFRERPEIGYLPVGVFTDAASPGAVLAGLPVWGGPHDAAPDVSVAIVPLAYAAHEPFSKTFDHTLSVYRHVLLLPEMDEDIFLWVRPRALGGLMGMEISSNLLDPFARLLKRASDLVFTLLLLPLWLPLLLLLTVVLALADRRTPFFRQPRRGRQGHVFNLIKFRTMVPDAERLLHEHLDQHADLRAEWEANWKLKRDPRVTRIGRWLRATSLDELPQLFNVLLGQMTLVGPRPLPEYHQAGLSETARRLREQVRPGITGLWQVSGRSASGNAGLERWDAYYVRNWSLWLDLVILARTLKAVFTGRGAY